MNIWQSLIFWLMILDMLHAFVELGEARAVKVSPGGFQSVDRRAVDRVLHSVK